jgi:hypothetical protein
MHKYSCLARLPWWPSLLAMCTCCTHDCTTTPCTNTRALHYLSSVPCHFTLLIHSCPPAMHSSRPRYISTAVTCRPCVTPVPLHPSYLRCYPCVLLITPHAASSGTSQPGTVVATVAGNTVVSTLMCHRRHCWSRLFPQKVEVGTAGTSAWQFRFDTWLARDSANLLPQRQGCLHIRVSHSVMIAAAYLIDGGIADYN